MCGLLRGHRSQQTPHDILQGIVPGTVRRRRYDPEYVTFEPRLPRDDTAAVMGKTGHFFLNQALDALCDLTPYFGWNTFVESDLIT
ncbi:hypothetical protein CJU94_38845 (plasmid) [Paraburkholderia aromaticivorans]|uniref:Uncharacterized protein n=1 Tax=Paraburkholderia aromaticivorans TaxID=2026199 RepID=A0A248VYK1_9BURK|nr:hypothetical protein CJU94_35920 [Paraburkholderia aromaticivorans]ASW03694.1 hypothetical protein CJU94_36460 [Paraburkholderia aromaticivorans]ASW04126.1 hypothetical protein CJU94_38845 [Paraburkholderia aromaticivorans]